MWAHRRRSNIHQEGALARRSLFNSQPAGSPARLDYLLLFPKVLSTSVTAPCLNSANLTDLALGLTRTLKTT
jgi:hypothetical protein